VNPEIWCRSRVCLCNKVAACNSTVAASATLSREKSRTRATKSRDKIAGVTSVYGVPGIFPILLNGPGFAPPTLPLPLGDPSPHLIHQSQTE